jgi:hypothetical protein
MDLQTQMRILNDAVDVISSIRDYFERNDVHADDLTDTIEGIVNLMALFPDDVKVVR